jgi:hypothetical protein
MPPEIYQILLALLVPGGAIATAITVWWTRKPVRADKSELEEDVKALKDGQSKMHQDIRNLASDVRILLDRRSR